jgi:hypothetical protein
MNAPGASAMYGPSLRQAAQTGRAPFLSISHIPMLLFSVLPLRRMLFRAAHDLFTAAPHALARSRMLVYIEACVVAQLSFERPDNA